MSATVEIFDSTGFNWDELPESDRIEGFGENEIAGLIARLKQFEVKEMITASISKDKHDYIHMSYMGDNDFLFQFRRNTKSASFLKRFVEDPDLSYTSTNDLETKWVVSNYLKMSRYDFESKYS